jgi:hypothetical protein
MSGWRANGGYLGPRPTGPSTSAASGWWDSRSQFRNKRDGQWPTVGDPYWANVSLLLPMNGDDASTTFTDASSNAATVTAVGNAQISTAHNPFGAAGSLLLDGTGDFLETPDNNAFEFGSEPFTLEAWLRFTSLARAFAFIGKDAISGTGRGFQWRTEAPPGLGMNLIAFQSGSILTQSHVEFPFVTNTWYHVASVRVGTTISHYVDGVLIGTGPCVGTMQNSTSTVRIGALTATGSNEIGFAGYMGDVRVTKGIARYTANFTPPSAPHPIG